MRTREGEGLSLAAPGHRLFWNQDGERESHGGCLGSFPPPILEKTKRDDKARTFRPSFKTQSNWLHRFPRILARAERTLRKTASFQLGPKIAKFRLHQCFILLKPREMSIMGVEIHFRTPWSHDHTRCGTARGPSGRGRG